MAQGRWTGHPRSQAGQRYETGRTREQGTGACRTSEGRVWKWPWRRRCRTDLGGGSGREPQGETERAVQGGPAASGRLWLAGGDTSHHNARRPASQSPVVAPAPRWTVEAAWRRRNAPRFGPRFGLVSALSFHGARVDSDYEFILEPLSPDLAAQQEGIAPANPVHCDLGESPEDNRSGVVLVQPKGWLGTAVRMGGRVV